MTGIEIVAKLAEQQKQYDDAHRPTRSPAHYRERHARRQRERRMAYFAISGAELTRADLSLPARLQRGVKPSERRAAV